MAPDRLARFFTRDEHHYLVSHELRDCVVFTVHDILVDAPFSNIDLVCCRNLLIYLQPEAQHKILSFFHFALRDGGVLFLGASEAVGSGERFESISKKHRVYRHVGRSRPGEIAFPTGARAGEKQPAVQTAKPLFGQASDFDYLSWRALIETFSLCSVLIDARAGMLAFLRDRRQISQGSFRGPQQRSSGHGPRWSATQAARRHRACKERSRACRRDGRLSGERARSILSLHRRRTGEDA